MILAQIRLAAFDALLLTNPRVSFAGLLQAIVQNVTFGIIN